MEEKVRKKRSDHERHKARAVMAIAIGKTTWREIAEEIGITMRSTFDLLKEMEKTGHVQVARPKGVQDRNTKPLKYGLYDDLGNFVYYIGLIKSLQKDYPNYDPIKNFMLTDYYIKAASGVCRIIAEHVEGTLVEFLLVNKDEEMIYIHFKNKEEGQLVLDDFASISLEIFQQGSVKKIYNLRESLKAKGWEVVFTYTDRWLLNIEMLKKALYERTTETKKGDVDSHSGSIKDPIEFLIKSMRNQRHNISKIVGDDEFSKVQRKIAIVKAAINDGLFYEVMYRVLTTFPDSVFLVAEDISALISRIMPSGYMNERVDSLFDAHNHNAKYQLYIYTMSRGLYLVRGNTSTLMLLEALNEISSGNAVIPEQFLEKYVIEDLRPKAKS